MALFPASIVGRLLAIAWLLACSGVLLFAWEQRHIHDMPEAFVWLMNFLTIPAGLPVAAVAGIATSEISKFFGITYHPFWDLVPFWIVITMVGYLQWFMLLPLLWRKLRAPRTI
jgi:hypothetical protein